MYSLCKQRKIKSIVLRQRGAARGIRLISYDSLMSYLHTLEAEQTQNEGGVANEYSEELGEGTVNPAA
jgi:hypothetical protein